MAISFQFEAQLSLINAGYPQFLFWILIALAKISFFHIVLNSAKILVY